MNNTMTIMGNNTTMTKCYANVGKNRTWFQRLKGYFLNNADYFADAFSKVKNRQLVFDFFFIK